MVSLPSRLERSPKCKPGARRSLHIVSEFCHDRAALAESEIARVQVESGDGSKRQNNFLFNDHVDDKHLKGYNIPFE